MHHEMTKGAVGAGIVRIGDVDRNARAGTRVKCRNIRQPNRGQIRIPVQRLQ